MASWQGSHQAAVAQDAHGHLHLARWQPGQQSDHSLAADMPQGGLLKVQLKDRRHTRLAGILTGCFSQATDTRLTRLPSSRMDMEISASCTLLGGSFTTAGLLPGFTFDFCHAADSLMSHQAAVAQDGHGDLCILHLAGRQEAGHGVDWRIPVIEAARSCCHALWQSFQGSQAAAKWQR